MVMTESLSDSSMSGEMHQPGSPAPPRGGGPLHLRSEEQMMGNGGPGLHSSLFCSRKQREFTPDSKKDDTYWDRRRRNNAAAKRSREKRRLNDMLLEKRVVQLSRENHILRAQVTAVFKSYGIRTETLIDMDQVMATLPTEDQLLNICSTPRSLSSPPPPEVMMSPPSMIGMPSPASPAEPTSPKLEDIYRHHFNPTQQHQQQRARSPSSMAALAAAAAAASTGTVQISPRSPPHSSQRQVDSSMDYKNADYKNSDLDISPPAPKRAYMAWDQIHERRAASSSSSSNVSSSCESNSGSDDPLNLSTCKSRSRSSSENEDEMMHMPHKLRYKYHGGGSQDNAGADRGAEHEY